MAHEVGLLHVVVTSRAAVVEAVGVHLFLANLTQIVVQIHHVPTLGFTLI